MTIDRTHTHTHTHTHTLHYTTLHNAALEMLHQLIISQALILTYTCIQKIRMMSLVFIKPVPYTKLQ